MKTLAEMCIAFTSTRPSRTPDFSTAAATSDVMFTNARRAGTCIHLYSVWLFTGPAGRRSSGGDEPHQRERVAVGILELAELQLALVRALDHDRRTAEPHAARFELRAERVDVGGVDVEDGPARRQRRLDAHHQPHVAHLVEHH